jgi:uncharacterized membrane protein
MMNHPLLLESAPTPLFAELVHLAVEAIEGLAVVIIVFMVFAATARFVYFMFAQRSRIEKSYEQYKRSVAKAMLLALELLVAADIIYTVILDPTLTAVAALVLLVVVRVFLGWSLIVETEGRWPWQPVRTE